MRSYTGYRFVSANKRSREVQESSDARRYWDLRKELIKWFNANPDITPPPYIVEIMNWKRRKKNP